MRTYLDENQNRRELPLLDNTISYCNVKSAAESAIRFEEALKLAYNEVLWQTAPYTRHDSVLNIDYSEIDGYLAQKDERSFTEKLICPSIEILVFTAAEVPNQNLAGYLNIRRFEQSRFGSKLTFKEEVGNYKVTDGRIHCLLFNAREKFHNRSHYIL